MEDKTHSILFILDNNPSQLKAKLTDICKDFIKAGHEVHVIYPSSDIDEDFELSLSKIPWIHIYKLPIRKSFKFSNLLIPVTIRKYINRHDGIDIIHSFGLNCGIIAYLSRLGLKTKLINTPDAINTSNPGLKPAALAKQFAIDNITFIFNRLCRGILFFSSDEKNKSAGHVSYKNIKSELVNITEDSALLSERLIQVYNS